MITNPTSLKWFVTSFTCFVLFSSLSFISAQTQKPDEGNTMCVGDPTLEYPKINPYTLERGLKGMPCWHVDEATKFVVSGECIKIEVCQAQSYTDLDGKEHVINNGDKETSSGSTFPSASANEEDFSFAPQSTPLPSSSDPLRSWQEDYEHPPVRTEESYDPATETRTVTEYNANGDPIKITEYSPTRISSLENEYSNEGEKVRSTYTGDDGSKIVTDYEGSATTETSYDPDGRKTFQRLEAPDFGRMEIVYNADGSKIVTDYEDDATTKTFFDSDSRKTFLKSEAFDGSRVETEYYYAPNTSIYSPPIDTVSEKFLPDGPLEQRTTTNNYGLEHTVERFDRGGRLTEGFYDTYKESYAATFGPNGEEYGVETVKNFNGQGDNLVISGDPSNPRNNVQLEVRDPGGNLRAMVEKRINRNGHIEMWGSAGEEAPRRLFNTKQIKEQIKELIKR